MPKLLSVTGLSDIGRVRRRNEDSFSLDGELGLAVVADGMGGHPGGDVASELAATSAADALRDALTSSAAESGFIERFRPIMERAVLHAHQQIRDRGAIVPHLDRMGTTLTAMITNPTTGEWIIGHVGDSRAYRLRDGVLEQITRDDTWIQQQIDRDPTISAANARNSPYAHLLTQCVGLEDPPTPQLLDGTARPGDTFLLCSDGLVGMLDDDALQEILSGELGGEETDTDAPLRRLLAAANEAGGNDNITAVMVRFGSG